jgi:hypothetical protein
VESRVNLDWLNVDAPNTHIRCGTVQVRISSISDLVRRSGARRLRLVRLAKHTHIPSWMSCLIEILRLGSLDIERTVEAMAPSSMPWQIVGPIVGSGDALGRRRGKCEVPITGRDLIPYLPYRQDRTAAMHGRPWSVHGVSLAGTNIHTGSVCLTDERSSQGSWLTEMRNSGGSSVRRRQLARGDGAVARRPWTVR